MKSTAYSSLWRESAALPDFPPLAGDTQTETLIIGGGMAGLLCAYYLQQAGMDYLLVEGRRLGGGITGDTTAKITSQHGLIYDKLLASLGKEKARAYLAANQRAVAEFGRLCAAIDCDFEEKDAYVYSMDDAAAIEREAAAVAKLGFLDNGSQITRDLPLPFKVAAAIKFPRQGQFHPLKFMAGIAPGLNIREQTFVQELAPGLAITNRGKIRAKQMIIASHFPFLNKHGCYFVKMYQHRSYAIALENAADIQGMYLEEKKDGLSFRNHNGYLIIGGGDHKTGKQGGNWQVLRELAKTAYPTAKERYAWATQDCMTLDSIPYIGRYSKGAEGLYVATGFNKWGMTSSMVAAMVLCDMLAGRDNEYAAVFSPQRSMVKPQLLVNGLAAAGNLLRLGGPRCPHLGYKLKWNTVEHSWDCPCHGSRFAEDGTLLDNPSTGGIRL